MYGLSTAAFIGVLVGGSIAFVLVVLALVFLCLHDRQHREDSKRRHRDDEAAAGQRRRAKKVPGVVHKSSGVGGGGTGGGGGGGVDAGAAYGHHKEFEQVEPCGCTV